MAHCRGNDFRSTHRTQGSPHRRSGDPRMALRRPIAHGIPDRAERGEKLEHTVTVPGLQCNDKNRKRLCRRADVDFFLRSSPREVRASLAEEQRQALRVRAAVSFNGTRSSRACGELLNDHEQALFFRFTEKDVRRFHPQSATSARRSAPDARGGAAAASGRTQTSPAARASGRPR